MPVELGKDKKGCFARWGEQGHKYYYDCRDKKALNEAKQKAYIQGLSIGEYNMEIEKKYNIGFIKKQQGLDLSFLKKESNQRYTLGVVYEPFTKEDIINNPNLTDAHGDFASEETIENACWNFMKYIQNHNKLNKHAFNVLKSLQDFLQDSEKNTNKFEVCLEDIEKAVKPSYPIGIGHDYWDESLGYIVECWVSKSDQIINGEKVKKGTWLLGIEWNDEIFNKILSEEITGLSLGGFGKRININDE